MNPQDLTPQQRLNTYDPKLLIMGIHKSGRMESVLCCTDDAIKKEIGSFVSVRIFELTELDANTFKFKP